jgi:16S rRNA (cytosine967-C5)-methyltransferase
MGRYHSYINSAGEILSVYKGEEPFTSFIKKYFSQHKKFGSKDRKQVSHLCYCYFRLGKALPDVVVEERILIALFLCSDEPHEVLEELKPGWNEHVTLPFDKKFNLIEYNFLADDIFPWQNELSASTDKQLFTLSHLQQPDLFLRVRPGKEEAVKNKLIEEKIKFQTLSQNCIALSNSSKIDELIELDKEAVVQDYSSQRVGEFLQSLKLQIPKNRDRLSNFKLSLWDCCAASGGKSIMAHDIIADIDLTVSDVREPILVNLRKRFAEAGIKKYKSFVADLTKPVKTIEEKKFNLIIADVPCSGSGTWGRTPEQLFYFDSRKIDEYAVLQRKIISTIIPHLASGSYLLYITCSVFKKENEYAVDFIKEKFDLELVKMELLKGYTKKADTMFAALLRRKS